MREIKFRGKSLTSGKWIYGSLYNDGAEDYVLPNLPQTAYDYEDYQVDLNTIGQYTGLKDKNGKEFFEGDIIIINRYNEKAVIDWNYELGTFTLRCHGYGIGLKPFGEWLQEFDLFLIGNIYDNPELINQ